MRNSKTVLNRKAQTFIGCANLRYFVNTKLSQD